MSDFTVHKYGKDVYGRTVLLTAFMHDWLEHRFDAVGFRLPIAQGAFMSRLGGGAAASQGAHDEGKCVDLIIGNLTAAQLDAWIWECRTHGGAAYRRDETVKHGDMPEHCHVTLGADKPGSPMANLLWASYVAGGDGLAAGPGRPGGAPDYERRPSPLVLTPPPEDDMTPAQFLALLEDPKVRDKMREIVWDAPLNSTADPKLTTKRKAGGMMARIEQLVTR